LNTLLLILGTLIQAVAVWQSGASLRRALPYFAERWIKLRLLSTVHFLMILPAVVSVVVGIVILIALKTQVEVRFAHAVFVLSLWMSAGMGMMVFMYLMRLRSPSIPALASMAISVPGAIYFTPLLQYQDVLATHTNMIALTSGLFLIVVCYGGLFGLRRRLSQ
jgi:hypothetical protein